MHQVSLLTTDEKWASVIVGWASCGISQVDARIVFQFEDFNPE